MTEAEQALWLVRGLIVGVTLLVAMAAWHLPTPKPKQ